jgi:Uma2 family endonuclease
MPSSVTLREMEPMPTPEFLEERRRLGLDQRDEVWDGVLHMVPPASFKHYDLGAELIATLLPLAKARELKMVYEAGLIDGPGWQNYRVPDLMIVDPSQVEDRGVVGAATLVIEILSPDDESRKKLPFYASRGVGEVWLVEPTTRVTEVLLLGSGTYTPSIPDARGVTSAPALGLALSVVAGPLLRVTWTGGEAQI